MAVELTSNAYKLLNVVRFKEGKHSSFKVCEYNKEEYLIKEFQQRNDRDLPYLERQIETLLKASPIPESGYPLELVKVDGKTIGYLCLGFPGTFSHSYVVTTSFPKYTLEERKKSAVDTTGQLKELHERGFIWHDVRLSNHLLDRKGGHIIDFEDSLPVENMEFIPPAMVNFYHYEGTNAVVNSPSFTEDKRKQILSHLSLLLNVDLEHSVYELGEEAYRLLSCLNENQEIEEVATEMFYSNDLPYFDAYLSAFTNPSELKRYGKRVHKNLKKVINLRYNTNRNR